MQHICAIGRIEIKDFSLRVEQAEIVECGLRILYALRDLSTHREQGCVLECTLLLDRALRTRMWESNYGSVFLQCPSLELQTRNSLALRNVRTIGDVIGCSVNKVQDLCGGSQLESRAILALAMTLQDGSREVSAVIQNNTLQITIQSIHSTKHAANPNNPTPTSASPQYTLVVYNITTGRALCIRNIDRGANQAFYSVDVDRSVTISMVKCALLCTNYVGIDSYQQATANVTNTTTSTIPSTTPTSIRNTTTVDTTTSDTDSDSGFVQTTTRKSKTNKKSPTTSNATKVTPSKPLKQTTLKTVVDTQPFAGLNGTPYGVRTSTTSIPSYVYASPTSKHDSKSGAECDWGQIDKMHHNNPTNNPTTNPTTYPTTNTTTYPTTTQPFAKYAYDNNVMSYTDTATTDTTHSSPYKRAKHTSTNTSSEGTADRAHSIYGAGSEMTTMRRKAQELDLLSLPVQLLRPRGNGVTGSSGSINNNDNYGDSKKVNRVENSISAPPSPLQTIPNSGPTQSLSPNYLHHNSDPLLTNSATAYDLHTIPPNTNTTKTTVSPHQYNQYSSYPLQHHRKRFFDEDGPIIPICEDFHGTFDSHYPTLQSGYVGLGVQDNTTGAALPRHFNGSSGGTFDSVYGRHAPLQSYVKPTGSSHYASAYTGRQIESKHLNTTNSESASTATTIPTSNSCNNNTRVDISYPSNTTTNKENIRTSSSTFNKDKTGGVKEIADFDAIFF